MPYVTGVNYDLTFAYAMAEANTLARSFCADLGYSEEEQDHYAREMQRVVASALPVPTIVRRDSPIDADKD